MNERPHVRIHARLHPVDLQLPDLLARRHPVNLRLRKARLVRQDWTHGAEIPRPTNQAREVLGHQVRYMERANKVPQVAQVDEQERLSMLHMIG